MPSQAAPVDEFATRTSLSATPSQLKRIDIAASIEARGNRSEFMIRAALAEADRVLKREGIKVA